MLVEMGQLTVSADPGDGRASLLRLTDAGRARLREIFDDGVAAYAALLEGWPTHDIEAFTGYLDRLSEALRAAEESAPARPRSSSRG